jgi:hypothetical protein
MYEPPHLLAYLFWFCFWGRFLLYCPAWPHIYGLKGSSLPSWDCPLPLKFSFSREHNGILQRLHGVQCSGGQEIQPCRFLCLF